MDSNLCISTIRSLCIDMINKANSGHPGMALGSAPALHSLFTQNLVVNPEEPEWVNRDRFVLASGHASALLYTMLHLSGYEMTIDDLKQFRQFQSITPGHPEKCITTGVDVSSGPLGQGIPHAVGLTLAEKFLSTKFNKDDFNIVDHYTYVLCGDGDMQEGVTYEAASLAGHLSLGKLIVIYDNNDVTLDGPLSYSFTENVKRRFESMNWQVIEVNDGNDVNAINRAIKRGKKELYKPTIIIMKTIIGYGSKKQGTNAVHGAPLGVEGAKYAKKQYGYNYEPFFVHEDVYDTYRKKVFNKGKRQYKKWLKLLKEYQNKYPELYQEYINAFEDKYTFDTTDILKEIEHIDKEASRDTNLRCINEIAKQNPTYLSGTADLSSSTKTLIKDGGRFSIDDYTGRNLYFGIREFAMLCIMNGMTLHKGVKVSGGGFLVFADYFKAGLRMASLMELPIILPLSHDSIAVGEDGPTHQPIEQLSMLRSMIDVQVLRPADAYETIQSWKIAIETKNMPTALILSRQNLVNFTKATYDDVIKGAYIVYKENGPLEGIMIASGSEVHLAVEAAKELEKQNHYIRVISMPSQELFDAQSQEYKDEILPRNIRKRLAIEMSKEKGWYKYVGLDGDVMGINTYGTSAPDFQVIEAYGFTVDHVVKKYLSL